MANSECPHCHRPTISFGRRLLLGPGTSVWCPECDARLSVPVSSLWTVMPVIVAYLITMPLESRLATWLVLLLGVVISVTLSVKFVPLVEKQ